MLRGMSHNFNQRSGLARCAGAVNDAIPRTAVLLLLTAALAASLLLGACAPGPQLSAGAQPSAMEISNREAIARLPLAVITRRKNA